MINKKAKFKSNKVHFYEQKHDGKYYMCNHAVGTLSARQLREKTDYGRENTAKITCKNCKRWFA